MRIENRRVVGERRGMPTRLALSFHMVRGLPRRAAILGLR